MSGYATSENFSNIKDQDFYRIQAIPCKDFNNLTIDENGIISPYTFGADWYSAGGILFIRVRDTLTFNGGHINLSGKGIPTDMTDQYRPLTTWEKGEGPPPNDISRLPLSVGDGMAIIFARRVVFTSNASRIGNITHNGTGINKKNPYDSTGLTQLTTNIGGSTIVIVSESITNLQPEHISCFRDITNDESLYRGLSYRKVFTEYA